MNQNGGQIAESFNKTLTKEAHAIITDAAEFGLDIFCDNEILQQIPVISTTIKLFNIGTTLRDKYQLLKLFEFTKALDSGITDEKQREKYRKDFSENVPNREKELEYLLIIIDRYIGLDKPRFLAKLFLAYLDREIKWERLCQYAEVIDRFLPGDVDVLKSAHTYRTVRDIDTDSLQRLIAQGLVVEQYRRYVTQEDGVVNIDPEELIELNEKKYNRTNFGNNLVQILCRKR